jgi:rubredoxin
MKNYECSICGYTYDQKTGDPENNIPPGTPFDSLPDDWTCPVCGTSKGGFNEV